MCLKWCFSISTWKEGPVDLLIVSAVLESGSEHEGAWWKSVSDQDTPQLPAEVKYKARRHLFLSLACSGPVESERPRLGSCAGQENRLAVASAAGVRSLGSHREQPFCRPSLQHVSPFHTVLPCVLMVLPLFTDHSSAFPFLPLATAAHCQVPVNLPERGGAEELLQHSG